MVVSDTGDGCGVLCRAKFRPELEEAFIESEKVMLARRGGEEEAAWAREFVARRGPPMPPPHMHMRVRVDDNRTRSRLSYHNGIG